MMMFVRCVEVAFGTLLNTWPNIYPVIMVFCIVRHAISDESLVIDSRV